MFTDSHNRTWCVLERLDKSISVYYVLPGKAAHYVVFDSLDTHHKIRTDAWSDFTGHYTWHNRHEDENRECALCGG